MICLRCSTGFSAVVKSSIAPLATKSSPLGVASRRTFTSFTPLRPTIFPSTFRPSLAISKPSPPSAATIGEAPLDLLPKISSHPGLATAQVRCGPRNTFNPSHFKRKRRHGFLSRIKTRKGRATLQRRKSKNRSTLSH